MLQAESIISHVKLFYIYVLFLYGNLRGAKKHVQCEHCKSQAQSIPSLLCSGLRG